MAIVIVRLNNLAICLRGQSEKKWQPSYTDFYSFLVACKTESNKGRAVCHWTEYIIPTNSRHPKRVFEHAPFVECMASDASWRQSVPHDHELATTNLTRPTNHLFFDG